MFQGIPFGTAGNITLVYNGRVKLNGPIALLRGLPRLMLWCWLLTIAAFMPGAGALAAQDQDHAAQAQPDHAPDYALAMHGDVALPKNFDHFPYANPNAPKGGRLTMGVVGTFDSLNPFVLQSMRTTARGLFLDGELGSLVYEPRRDESGPGERGLPRGAFRDALAATQELWARLDDLEQDHRLPGSAPVATGLAPAMHAWARGASLDRVLQEADLAAGDFVRWTKQTIDLLDQLSMVADPPIATTARSALDAVRRGIVAYGSF